MNAFGLGIDVETQVQMVGKVVANITSALVAVRLHSPPPRASKLNQAQTFKRVTEVLHRSRLLPMLLYSGASLKALLDEDDLHSKHNPTTTPSPKFSQC